jgi:hypothetical protein
MWSSTAINYHQAYVEFSKLPQYRTFWLSQTVDDKPWKRLAFSEAMEGI